MDGITTLICDLDNTLFDPATIPHSVLAPAHDALRAANIGPDAIPTDALERAIQAAWTRPFDAIAAASGLPAKLVDAWRTAHQQLAVTTPLHPYADAWMLADLPILRLLATTGFRRFQESKIAALEIGTLFHGVYIDAIDAPNREGKRRLFERIVSDWHLRPEEVLVLGDSAEAELHAGAQLGMVTVQVLRPGILRSPEVRHHITSFAELLTFRWDAPAR